MPIRYENDLIVLLNNVQLRKADPGVSLSASIIACFTKRLLQIWKEYHFKNWSVIAIIEARMKKQPQI